MGNRSIIIATPLREHGATGIQTHCNSYCKYLMDNGLETKVVTPFSAPAALVYPIFSVRRIIDPISKSAGTWWYRHWHCVFLKWALQRVLRRAATPLTIYAQGPEVAEVAMQSRTSPKQRVVVAIHFNVSQADEWANKGRIAKGGWLYAAIKRAEAKVLPRVDGLVYVSEFMRSRLEEAIPGVRAVASIVIPNFIASPEPSIRPAMSGDIITIGTLEPRKNQSFLLHVIAEANRVGGRYTLTIAGDGPDRRGLELLARKLGVAEQVRFLGFVPRASQLIPGHRIYCHSAKMESFGIVLIEAMACGLPVLAAPVGGIPEVFSDGVEGCYWPLDDAVSAARILISVLDDPERYAAMSKAALQKFNMCYEMETVASGLDKFLNQHQSNEYRQCSADAGAE
jgi:glycosyltransferase involved in cell wall biosynthesis